MNGEETQAALHQAITDHVTEDEGEVVTKWMLVAEVSYPNGGRFISHRAGTFDGDSPQIWDGLGLIECARDNLLNQFRHVAPRDYEDGAGDAKDGDD